MRFSQKSERLRDFNLDKKINSWKHFKYKVIYALLPKNVPTTLNNQASLGKETTQGIQ